jgi:hypothetical protein
VVQDDLVATLGEKAIAYSMVTKYLREAQINPDDATALSDAASLHIDGSDEDILRALEEILFSSVRQLARAIHLRCVPYLLSDDQKAKWVQCSRVMGLVDYSS